MKNYNRLFWSTEAWWQIARLPINLNEDHSIHIAHDIIVTNKRGRSGKSHESCQMHISDKLKTYSCWFWSSDKSHGFKTTEMLYQRRATHYCKQGRRSDQSHGSQSYQMHIIDKLKNCSRFFFFFFFFCFFLFFFFFIFVNGCLSDACWQISRLPINLNADRTLNEAKDCYCYKGRRSDKSHGSQAYQMHNINGIVKNYRRLVWSTEACWKISRLPIFNLNAYRSMNETQDIIIVT